jgi:methionine-rich copper-binding protein CopC
MLLKLKLMRLDFRKFALPIFMLLQLIWAQQLHAEGVLLAGQPQDNAEISNFDGKISLSFSGNVSERWPSLLVVDSKGGRVDNKDVALEIGPRSKLTASTKTLSPGPYVIRYRVVTEDGLIVSGIRRFTIKN